MTEKEKFLCDEFQMLSWNGSVQRNPTYKKGESPSYKRVIFREGLFDYCDKELLPMYKNQEICECIHYKNIKKLKEEAEGYENGKILLGGKYKIGTAQKLLNLYLKYLWCKGMSKKPTHCPLDGKILNHVDWPGESWTKWKCIDEYKDAIAWIKKYTGGEHIADWELRTFNKLR